MAIHSSVLAWRIPWTEEPGGLLSMRSQRIRHDWSGNVCMHALEKEMSIHSSVLAWRIPGTEEPCGLPSLGSHRVGHDWSDLAAEAAKLFCPKWSMTKFKFHVDIFSSVAVIIFHSDFFLNPFNPFLYSFFYILSLWGQLPSLWATDYLHHYLSISDPCLTSLWSPA